MTPSITTKQTEYLRSQYPSLSYLEKGAIAEWLQERKDQLFEQAISSENEADAARVVSLATTAIGSICYAVNPFMLVGSVIGGAAWLWFVTEHYARTKEIAPLPFVRGNFIDALNRAGDFDARSNHKQNHLGDTIKFLQRHEAEEYVFLYSQFEQISQYLNGVEAGKRFYAYRWLLGCFNKFEGSKLPSSEEMSQHLLHVAVDTRVNVEEMAAIPAPVIPVVAQVERQSLPPQSTVYPEKVESASGTLNASSEKLPVIASAKPKALAAPDLQSLLSLPLTERAIAFVDLLDKSGFDLARCIRKQVTVIAGAQRGGKGTLMGILSILSAALKPGLKVHYFTAGEDVYPFQCDKLVCAKSFPYMEDPDAKVASELIRYLKEMERAKVGEYSDRILVIDEAVALGEYIEGEEMQWMIKFLLTRAAKKGARIFIVLHGQNLTSWTGTGKTGGFASTFKTSVSFVGCESMSKKLSPLETIDVATGRYFLADPDEFAKALPDGEIGTLPDWLKTETNPLTGQPDPVRTLLKVFPELHESDSSHQTVSSPQEIKTVEIEVFEGEVEEVRETELQTAISDNKKEEVAVNKESRENDWGFIKKMTEIAKNHLFENEWVDFDIEKLRKINKFRESEAKRHLNKSEALAVAELLCLANVASPLSSEQYQVKRV